MPDHDPPLFAPPAVARRELDRGAFVLSSRIELGPYPRHVCEDLERWAEEAPERTFVAERRDDGWRKLGYAEARRSARGVASALLERGLGAEDPVMILSDNGIDHALLQLGCLYAGVPVAPISPAYSLMSEDFGKLVHITEQLRPRLVFAADGAKFGEAIDALPLAGAELVVSENPPTRRPTTAFEALTGSTAGAEVERAYAALEPSSVAKILFTSGSTGVPKGVINTHRMLCSNQQAIAQMWPFVERRPPVIVDWLPWNHTFGSNHNLNLVLRNGGTLYIDGGKPAPGLFEQSVANLREIAPTIYFNVPRGYDMLLPYLEADAPFRDHFFSQLDLIFYAAAALPQSSWERLEALSAAARGERVAMTSAWGSTETAPLATCAHFPLERAGVVGVPAPGTEIKLVPDGDKLELRVRGPNVTPAYFQQEELTHEAFDDEGFYRTGDAGKLADEDDPSRGIVFDGRVAEDFKLLTGAWVSVGALRVDVLAAAAPMIQDAVVTGHDRDDVGLLIFPSLPGCASVAGVEASETTLEALVDLPEVRARLVAGIAAHNRTTSGSSRRIARVLLLTEPPSIDADEITDKGYINQRAVLTRRADLVTALYEGTTERGVILLP